MSALLSQQLETGKFVEHQSRRFLSTSASCSLSLDAFFLLFFFFSWLLCQDDQTQYKHAVSERSHELMLCMCVGWKTRFHFKVDQEEAAESLLRAREADARSLFIKSGGLLLGTSAGSSLVPPWAVYISFKMKNLCMFKMTTVSDAALVPPLGGEIIGSCRQNHLCE